MQLFNYITRHTVYNIDNICTVDDYFLMRINFTFLLIILFFIYYHTIMTTCIQFVTIDNKETYGEAYISINL